MFFENRKEAGKLLAEKLRTFSFTDPVVIALPRGGVPVAYEIAEALHAPLDVIMVRKIGMPHNPEYGVGAISEAGTRWMDHSLISRLSIDPLVLRKVIETETHELKRRMEKFRHGNPVTNVWGKSVILVDDGLATGATTRVGCRYLKTLGPKEIILAVPVCSPSAVKSLQSECDQIICLEQPVKFRAVGEFYFDFDQTEDSEVLSLLEEAKSWRPPASSSPPRNVKHSP